MKSTEIESIIKICFNKLHKKCQSCNDRTNKICCSKKEIKNADAVIAFLNSIV
ncbi:MAG: hypothetical protein GY756_24660 [bacterium]|nr:hypothetical protein [bacterium]